MDYIEVDPVTNGCARCSLSLGGGPVCIVLGSCKLYHRECHEEISRQMQVSYAEFMRGVRGATWGGLADMPPRFRGLMGDENVKGIDVLGSRAMIVRAHDPREVAVSGLADMEGFRTTFYVRQYATKGWTSVDFSRAIRDINRLGGPAKCEPHPTCCEVFATFVKGTGEKKDRLVVVVVKRGGPGAPTPDQAADGVAKQVLGDFELLSATDYPGSRVCDGACYHMSTPEADQWAVAADPSVSIFESARPILARTKRPDAPLVFAEGEGGDSLEFVDRMNTYYTRV